MIEQFRSILEASLSGPPSARISKVAFLIFPGFVISCIFSQFTALGILPGSEESILSVALPVYHDLSSGEGESPTIALILDPNAGDFSVPWQSGRLRKLLLSLTTDAYKVNKDRLRVNDERLEGKFPLLGVNRPVVLIAEGVEAHEILLPGKRLKLESLGMYSTEATSKALWPFVISMFAFGLVIRSQEKAKGVTGKKARRSRSDKKRESEVVNGDRIEARAGVDRVIPS